MKLNSTLLKSTVVAALGGLLFGFDTAVIAGATQALKTLYQLSPLGEGFTVASALVGTVIGSMLAGIPGDRYGRRDSLRGMAALYVVSALGCALAWKVGGIVSVQRGVWDSARVLLQLCPRDDGLWRGGMAMEARSFRRAGRLFLSNAFWNSAQPAVAGEERKNRRSPRGAAADR